MKRSSERDTPPRSKRSRSTIGRYEGSSDERITPERVRRCNSREQSHSPMPRYMSPHRDEYMRPPERAYKYKVLCIRALHQKASDEVIKDTLYREYKKFGDLSIRISHDMDDRVAYVCFRNQEDAREAKHAKSRIIIYNKVALVEAIYEVARTSSEMFRSRPISPEYNRHYYARSPERLRPIDRYKRTYGHPQSGVQIHREFRREVLQVPHPEYLTCPPMHHGSLYITPSYYGPQRHATPRIPFEKSENKKEKFPNYLHHIQPEDDPLATRTLFAGNLEINITEEELRKIFGRYGAVEDIDIKRPLPGTGNAFAFVRFHTLDMAHCAKVELSGQYIGKFQCKIGYGKATPTTRIWVGGLGPWTSVIQLEREFDRFGAIKKIDYIKGEIQAYILYDSIDAAQTAVKKMRGYSIGTPEHRLRTDFADVIPNVTYRPKSCATAETGADYRHLPDEYKVVFDEGGSSGYVSRYRDRPLYPEPRTGSKDSYRYANCEWVRTFSTDGEYDRHRTGSTGSDRSLSLSPNHSMDSDSESGSKRVGLLASSRTLPEIARKCITTWQGALILKNSLFPAKFYLIDGALDIIEGLMKDEDGKHQLRITQRLRLDQPKLEDVQKRISSASHAILLGLTGSMASITNDGLNAQTRPLRNLVSYLKQKEAAGVISLQNKKTEATGVLYSFPPCSFSTELLKRTCRSLPEDALKEDHLVIVVVRGGRA